jgi:hypothetical protein
MKYLSLKQCVILGILLFDAPSEAANRGEWKLAYSENVRDRDWIRESFPEVYVHHHHRSSGNRKMNMGMMNTMAPTKKPPTRKPTKRIPTSKPTVMQMGKKGMNTMTMAPITSAPITTQPVANPPTGSTPTGDSPTENAPTGDVPTGDTPIGDAPIANGLAEIGSRSSGNSQIDKSPFLREFTSRIVGGTPAGTNEFKFIASLGGCGGSLIAPGIILTAAHCAGNIRSARIGSSKANSGGVVKKVVTECVHPNYQSSTTTNDYMLLKLDSLVDINQYPPIQLNNNKAVPKTNQILTVIGFGATSEGGSVSNSLLKVNVPANSHQQCNQQYGGSIVESVMFCAGEKSGGKDSCQGDSGGPIFEIRGGTPVQLGVVSFGEGCARPNRSGVYSRVSGAYDWIQTTMVKLNNGDTSGCRGGKPSPPSTSPAKTPTRKPVRVPTKRPTESPTEEPVAPVGPPTSPSSPTSNESPTYNDDGSNDDDSWNLWS